MVCRRLRWYMCSIHRRMVRRRRQLSRFRTTYGRFQSRQLSPTMTARIR